MPRSLDFNWNEGDDGFDPANADFQPPPAAATVEPPTVAAARTERGPRIGRLGLMALGIVVGMVVGVAILSWQGQRAARADLTPLFVLEHQALAGGDEDIYRSLFDEAQMDYREAAVAGLANSAMVFDADANPQVRGLRVTGDTAEVQIDSSYQGQVYRRMETARLVGGQWRLIAPNVAAWGGALREEGENVTLHIYRRDADLARLLPRLDAIAQAFCRRYNPPPPCHLDLTLTPEADLLPFNPSSGASPAPPLVAYRSVIRDDERVVVLNGDGRELQDPDFRASVRDVRGRVRNLGGVSLSDRGTEAIIAISSARLSGETMPLRYPSPRLVGLKGREPHPLWWLGVSEAIGDVIARRAVGPIRGEATAALTAWAALRGDVAIWAERFSGVSLPDEDETAWLADPADIGISLITARGNQRQAARRFALDLHARFGEGGTLDWLLNLGGQMLNGASPSSLDDLTVDQLRQFWRERLAG